MIIIVISTEVLMATNPFDRRDLSLQFFRYHFQQSHFLLGHFWNEHIYGFCGVIKWWCIEDYKSRSDDTSQSEDPQEESVEYHRYVLPVFLYLQKEKDHRKQRRIWGTLRFQKSPCFWRAARWTWSQLSSSPCRACPACRRMDWRRWFRRRCWFDN